MAKSALWFVFTLVLSVSVLSEAARSQINPFGRSGFNLTAEDVELLKAAAAKLYRGAGAPVGTRQEWSNAKSKNKGTVELVKQFTYKTMPCKRLQHDITIATERDPFRFIVDRCRVNDGTWKLL